MSSESRAPEGRDEGESDPGKGNKFTITLPVGSSQPLWVLVLVIFSGIKNPSRGRPTNQTLDQPLPPAPPLPQNRLSVSTAGDPSTLLSSLHLAFSLVDPGQI